MSPPVYETTENDLLIEPDQLIHGNDDAKSNDDKDQVYIENNQPSQENTRKRKLASIPRKISPKKEINATEKTDKYRKS